MGESETEPGPETETEPGSGDDVEYSALHPWQKVLGEVRRKVLINPELVIIHTVQTSAD